MPTCSASLCHSCSTSLSLSLRAAAAASTVAAAHAHQPLYKYRSAGAEMLVHTAPRAYPCPPSAATGPVCESTEAEGPPSPPPTPGRPDHAQPAEAAPPLITEAYAGQAPNPSSAPAQPHQGFLWQLGPMVGVLNSSGGVPHLRIWNCSELDASFLITVVCWSVFGHDNKSWYCHVDSFC